MARGSPTWHEFAARWGMARSRKAYAARRLVADGFAWLIRTKTPCGSPARLERHPGGFLDASIASTSRPRNGSSKQITCPANKPVASSQSVRDTTDGSD